MSQDLEERIEELEDAVLNLSETVRNLREVVIWCTTEEARDRLYRSEPDYVRDAQVAFGQWHMDLVRRRTATQPPNSARSAREIAERPEFQGGEA